jgi:hypothetical protein
MVVELAFIFSLAIHFCHLLEGIEHALDNLLVGIINTCSYLEIVRANELGFHLANVNREVFDEVGHTLALFAGKLGLFNPFNLVVLEKPDISLLAADGVEGLQHGDRINLSVAYVVSLVSEAKMCCPPRLHQLETVLNRL